VSKPGPTILALGRVVHEWPLCWSQISRHYECSQGSPVSPISNRSIAWETPRVDSGTQMTPPFSALDNHWKKHREERPSIFKNPWTGRLQRHFIRPREDRSHALLTEGAETMLTIRHGSAVTHPEAAMRWLGLSGLIAKAQAVAHHLRSLGDHSARAPMCRGPVRACVEPILLSGVEAWCPGTPSPRRTI
jgi:hypothetical protein